MLAAKWIRKSSMGLLSLGLLMSVSGCWTAPDATTSAEYGAMQGALIGAVFGCSSAYNFSSRHNEATAFAIGCPAGLAAGAVIGGIAGYAMYGPPPEKWQPPAKQKPTTSSLSPSPGDELASGIVGQPVGDMKADNANQSVGHERTFHHVDDLSSL
jgi:hypothetical protein